MGDLIIAIGVVIASCMVVAGWFTVQMLRIGRRVPERPRATGAEWRRTGLSPWLKVWLADFYGARLTVKAASMTASPDGRPIPASVTWSVRRGGIVVGSGHATYDGCDSPPLASVEIAKVAAERSARKGSAGR